MLVLAIETSCDDTGVAVVQDGRRILSNIVSSQIPIHKKYGGVVPELASRKHIESIVPIVTEALNQADAKLKDMGGIAVTHGPGLVGSLLVGLSFAKSLSFATGIPLIGINHIEGHLSAIFLEKAPPKFPFIGLVVSGGHTSLYRMDGYGKLKRLGQTRDDAAGEAFDKVAKRMGLGYPGGETIDRLGKKGDRRAIPFPRVLLEPGSCDFSFSGLKTSIINTFKDRVESGEALPLADIAASFQEAVVDVLVTKTLAAAGKHGVSQILLAGGVAANKLLRETMAKRSPIPVLIPPIILCTDNAAMVASCGYFRLLRGKIAGWDLDVLPGLSLGVKS